MTITKRLSALAMMVSLGAPLAITALPPAGAVLAQGAQQQSATSGQPSLPGPSDGLLAELENIYKDIHANPELAFQETRTAGIAADWLREQGYEVTEGVGSTGVVGVLRNGEGGTVLLRADMDALPMAENTGLPYASTKTVTDESGQETPVAHSCGHDMHVAWLMGATQILAENRDHWSGTVMAVFQPAEETGEGARAMIDDGMVERFPKPDVVLAQHVLTPPAGQIGIKPGIFLSMSDSLAVTLHGSGGHGSSPETTVDPVVMAAAAIMRLQTVVSREIAMMDDAVVTVGSVQAGSSGNIIPGEAQMQLNIRTFDDQVRETVLSSIERIINAEAAASGAPQAPEISAEGHFPLTVNDEDATEKVADSLQARFAEGQVQEMARASASEDFSHFARAWDVPSVYWSVGGTDPQLYAQAAEAGQLNQIPSNHSPEFAPVIDPTLRVGVEAMLAAAEPWLTPEGAQP